MNIREDKQWWSVWREGGDAGERLCSLIEEMRMRQATLHENTKRLLSVYQYGYKAGYNMHPEHDVGLDETRSAYNMARNVVNTVFSKVIRSRILPMALTNGGGYYERRRAKDFSQAIEGEFDENNVDEIKEDVVLDALTTYHGAGCAKVYTRGGRVCIEHVPIEDLRFDESETRYRKPRNAYHVQRMDRFVCADLFGETNKMRQKILAAPKAKDGDGRVSLTSDDQIDVYEAWHLPSSCESAEDESSGRLPETDGRHVIAVEGCTVVDEEWIRDSFPFALYVPRKRRRSIWGIGMMFDLAAPQREYETLTADFQNAHKRMGMSGFIAERSSDVNEKELANARGIVVEYTGPQPPQPFTPQPVHPDQYAYRDSIPANMMAANGVSPLAAQSQLPAGLQQASGKALQVFNDFESERNMPEHRELERWHVRLSWLVVEEARDIAAQDPEYTSRYRDKNGFRELKWKDVLLDRDAFVLKVFPISALSSNPSAKFAQLTDWLKAGAITPEQWRRLQDLPDLESENELDSSDVDVIDQAIDDMLMHGEPRQAQSFDNLALIVQRAGKAYNLYRQDKVPEDRLQLIREYIESAQAEIEKQKALDAARQQAAQQDLQAPMGAPMPGPDAGVPPMMPMPMGAA
jgi:hypothetical protein